MNKKLLSLSVASLLVNMMVAPDIWAGDSPSLPIAPDSEVWTQPESPILLYQPEVKGEISLI